MSSCVVKWCRKRKDRLKNQTGITYHTFPKNEIRRINWIKAVRFERREEDWMPTIASKVCSIHFSDEDMYMSSKGYNMLKKSAVPICTMVRKIYLDSQESPDKMPCIILQELVSTSQKDTVQQQNISTPSSSQWDPHLNKINSCTLLPASVAGLGNVQMGIIVKFDQHGQDLCFTGDNRAQTNKRMVKCPNCRYEFANDEKVNFPPDKKERILQPIDTRTVVQQDCILQSCSTPINVPSSEIESEFITLRTNSLKQKLKKKSLLAEKRFGKIKNLQRKNKRLLLKNKNLKNILSTLKKKVLSSQICTSLGEFSEDIIANLRKNKNKKGRTKK